VPSYRFDSQALYDSEIIIRPGESLILHCEYESLGRAGAVSGPASSDEMCGSLMYYYPKLPVPPSCSGPPTNPGELCTFPCLSFLTSIFVKYPDTVSYQWPQPKARKDEIGDGRVYFQGLAQYTSTPFPTSATIAQVTYDLPAPTKRTLHHTICGGVYCRMDVTPASGDVTYWTAGTANFAAFDGVWYDTTDAEYVEPTLNSPWAPYPGEVFFTPSYRKIGNWVYLRGLLNGGNYLLNTVIFVLPEGSRPEKLLIFNTAGNGAPIKVTISAEGEVSYASGITAPQDFLSLDGIAFSVIAEEWNDLPLADGWEAYGPNEASPKYVRRGDLVHLSGVVESMTPTATVGFIDIALLPEGYRPATRRIYGIQANVPSRLDIDPAGNVTVYWTTEGVTLNWASIQGLSFPISD